jgi:type II secretory pathway component GspD/PulD (secretin)
MSQRSPRATFKKFGWFFQLRRAHAAALAAALILTPVLRAQEQTADDEVTEEQKEVPAGLFSGTGAKKPVPAAPATPPAAPLNSGDIAVEDAAANGTSAQGQSGSNRSPYQLNSQGQPIVDLGFPDSRIEVVMATINEQQPVKVSLFGKTAGERVSLFLEGATLEEALGAITRPKGWVYWKLEGDQGYGIADRAYFEAEILPKQFVQKVFQPKHLKASELQKAIADLLTKGAANGSAIADDRTNKLIVNDLPVVIERVERLLREVDIQLITRVFRIRHADVEEMAKKIEPYKSGPGTIELDPKTHLIIVSDLLANIKKMELLIDILDVGPEIVIYDVNNIGIDGKDLESLQNIIDSIRTEDLLFEVNNKQGVFILEDVPSVQERVEQILRSFDRPVKQVQIQGEIVQTGFDRTFNLGIDRFAYSGDMVDAIRSGAVPSPFSVGSADLPLDNLGFKNISETFPTFDMTGNSITGSFLSQSVYLQASAVFSDSTTNILLQPNLLVKNQEASRLFIGSETPFLTTFFNDNDTGGSTRSSTQQRIQDGLELEITPSIANSYLIELDIKINNDKAFDAGENDGITLIGRNRQNIETILQIPSGQTRVIGGLIVNEQVEGRGGVPFLSTLPIVGSLFGKRTSADGRDTLMMFITPTVVEDELPFQTGSDGRRGRLVSEYEEIGDEPTLSEDARRKIEEELQNLSEAPEGDGMLSSDADDEFSSIQFLRDQLAEDDASGSNPFANSNYSPTPNTGTGTSINSGGGAVATPPPGQGGGRPGGQGQPGGRRRGRPGGQQGVQEGVAQPPGGEAPQGRQRNVPPDLQEKPASKPQ